MNLGKPSTWVLGVSAAAALAIDACLRLPGAPSIVKLQLPAVTWTSSVSKQPSFPYASLRITPLQHSFSKPD